MFEVSSEQFSGPLELLLELIEEEKLSISEVSLAKVAESYLKHIEEFEPPADELADFLLVATRLLLLKSRHLLPEVVPEQEEETLDLAAQLKLYKIFVDLSKNVEAAYQSPQESFAKPKAEEIAIPHMLIPDDLTVSALHEACLRVVKAFEPFMQLKEVAMERIVTVKERFQELKNLIAERAQISFREFIASGKSKGDVVTSFLALLELVKQRVVHVNQSESFEDIDIKRVE